VLPDKPEKHCVRRCTLSDALVFDDSYLK